MHCDSTPPNYFAAALAPPKPQVGNCENRNMISPYPKPSATYSIMQWFGKIFDALCILELVSADILALPSATLPTFFLRLTLCFSGYSTWNASNCEVLEIKSNQISWRYSRSFWSLTAKWVRDPQTNRNRLLKASAPTHRWHRSTREEEALHPKACILWTSLLGLPTLLKSASSSI